MSGGRVRAFGLVALCIAIGCTSAALTQVAIAQPRSARTGTPQKQPSASAYSKAEIDKKIDQLRKEILSMVPSKQELEGRLATLSSKSDIDAALQKFQRSFSQQTVSQTELTTRLTKLDDDAKDREQKAYQRLDSRIPQISPWVGSLIASLAAVISSISAVISYSAKTQTRALAAQATASEFVQAWRGSDGWGIKHANALNSLAGAAGPIDEDGLNNIVDVFNWFEDLVEAVAAGRATEQPIKRAGFEIHAEKFLNALTESGSPEEKLKELKSKSGTLKFTYPDNRSWLQRALTRSQGTRGSSVAGAVPSAVQGAEPSKSMH
jgi:hypothetical protein